MAEVLMKIDLESKIKRGDKIILELGCGPSKKEGRIGIDRLNLPNVDIVTDLENGLFFLPDNSVDEIHSKSFLEHIENFEFLMCEIFRVLKKQGRVYIFVPHFSNPYYYSDYTHRRFFGLYSFDYFVNSQYQLKRKVPNFYTNIRFRVISRRLVFHSPFLGRKLFKKIMNKLFNINSYMQEFYEENLCYIFPCCGIEFILTPDK